MIVNFLFRKILRLINFGLMSFILISFIAIINVFAATEDLDDNSIPSAPPAPQGEKWIQKIDENVLEYRPIVILHGINSSPEYMQTLKKRLENDYPGRYIKVLNIDYGHGDVMSSFANLNKQEKSAWDEITSDANLRDGYDIIAHSQGALTMNTLIKRRASERAPEFKIHNVVFLGGPLRGIFGIPDVKTSWWSKIPRNIVWEILYSKIMQHSLSVADMWHDPKHEDKYLCENCYLPIVNNEVDHPNKDIYRENYLLPEMIVYLKSDKDEVITPHDSSWFNFYRPKSSGETEKDIEQYCDTEYYKHDVLGIKEREKSGKIKYLLAHCAHTEMTTDESVYRQIRPFIDHPLTQIQTQNGLCKPNMFKQNKVKMLAENLWNDIKKSIKEITRKKFPLKKPSYYSNSEWDQLNIAKGQRLVARNLIKNIKIEMENAKNQWDSNDSARSELISNIEFAMKQVIENQKNATKIENQVFKQVTKRFNDIITYLNEI
ncbi:MAG: hypothetical protein HQK49_05780 [Oligoflexia bacterium]|nr:hypothetical protein [Oligoflexia bacterium]